ncbi:MAG: hypothetical protein ACOCM8_07330 [Acetivibrio ethanolgignens]
MVGIKSFANYVSNRLFALGRQRLALKQTEEQAEAFLEIFASELSGKNKTILEAFVAMKTAGFLKKRYLLIKYGFWKTGLLRNIGVFFLV